MSHSAMSWAMCRGEPHHKRGRRVRPAIWPSHRKRGPPNFATQLQLHLTWFSESRARSGLASCWPPAAIYTRAGFSLARGSHELWTLFAIAATMKLSCFNFEGGGALWPLDFGPPHVLKRLRVVSCCISFTGAACRFLGHLCLCSRLVREFLSSQLCQSAADGGIWCILCVFVLVRQHRNSTTTF